MEKIGDYEYVAIEVVPGKWDVNRNVVGIRPEFVAHAYDEAAARKIAQALNYEDGV